MVVKPFSPGVKAERLTTGVANDYRPFETPEPNIVFTGAIPQYWAMIYMDRAGNVRETSNLGATVFNAEVKQQFLAAKNNAALQGHQTSILPAHTIYSPAISSSYREQSRRPGHPKRRRTTLHEETLSVSCMEADNEEDDLVTLKIGDTQKVTAYYENAFRRLQQLNCRMLAKNFIKFIEPRKQVKHPYNGGKAKAGAAPGEKGDPEKTKPDWWPRDVIHREPDHLRKDFRLKLLVHIVQRLLPMGITADKLEEAANDVRRHIKPQERATILDELFRVRRLEERFERNEVDASARVYVMDHEGAKKREGDSDDEQQNIPTPPESPNGTVQDDELNTREATLLPNHEMPMTTTPRFQMNADIGFANQMQQASEFQLPQSEMGHRSLATTPIAGPFLTPIANQFMDHHQQFTDTPAGQMHGASQSPAHAQAEQSAPFTGWSSSFQQNIFSPVEFHGAGRQVHTQMTYPTYTTYPSPHGQNVSSAYTIPDLERSRETDMMSMVNLPFRTGSLSHPHVLHRPDSGPGPNL